MATDLVQRIKKLQSSARGNRVALPFADVADVFTISWLEPDPKIFKKFEELDDVADELAGWLPIGKADGQCVVAARKSPHRVAVFMEDFWALAPSLDDFFARVLLAKGEKSPGQKLSAAIDKAHEKLDAEKPKDAKALLAPLLEDFMVPSPTANGDTLEELDDLASQAWHLLGVAEHGLGDDVRSLAAYERAQAWNRNALSGANIMAIHLDAGRFAEAITVGDALLAEFSTKVPMDEELDLRSRRFVAQVKSGKKAAALKDLGAWSKKARPKDRSEMKKVLTDALAEYALGDALNEASAALK